MTVYSFNGEADNTDLGSVSGWARVSGSSGNIKVNSDGKVDFAAADSCYRTSAGSADHTVEITYATPTPSDYTAGFFPCCVRVTDINNFIGARFFGTEVQLYKRVSSTFTVLGQSASSATTGTTLKLSANGNTLNVYVNGVLKIGPITESAHNTVAYAGMVGRVDARADLIDAAEVIDLNAASTSLTDVDTDETITTGQTSVAYTGTGLTDADGLKVKSGSESAAATSFSATNATSGTFTAPSLNAVLTGGVKFGSVTFDIQDGGVSLATLSGTLNPQTGWTVHNVSDISQAADTGCIYYGQSPAVAVGDQIIFQSTTNLAYPVTIDSQGFFTVNSGGSTATTSFDYYVWDDTDNTWGAIGTITINEDADPGFSAGSGRVLVRPIVRAVAK